MLIFEALEDNEAILIEGFETFSAYAGYGRTLQYAGNFQESTKVPPYYCKRYLTTVFRL